VSSVVTRWTPAGPLPVTRRTLIDALRGITRKEVRAAFLFGLALFSVHMVGMLMPVLQDVQAARWRVIVLEVLGGLLDDELFAFALMVALVVGNHVTGESNRRLPYVLALIVCALLVLPLDGLVVIYLQRQSRFGWPQYGAVTAYDFFDWMVLGIAAILVYVDRRRARVARDRMHEAQLERTQTAKRTLESRLQAMQARVEPQFLFNTLANVEQLYQTDAARAERMLDDLITYLRAAMPRMRDTTSTLGQEAGLARAYLAIVARRFGDRLHARIDVADDIAEARFPPLLLLPLIDHALGQGADPEAREREFGIAAYRNGDSLELVLDDSGSGFAPKAEEAAIADLRERLAALYGEATALELARSDGSTRARLTLPYQVPAPETPEQPGEVAQAA
jgi:hypothetical protein